MSLASLAVFSSLNGSAYPCTLRATQFPALVLRAILLTILVIAFRWICATGRPGSCASGGGVALFQSNPDTRTRKAGPRATDAVLHWSKQGKAHKEGMSHFTDGSSITLHSSRRHSRS